MKDFCEMTDEEFAEAREQAKDSLWSDYAVFANDLMGYKIMYNGRTIPKWQLWAAYKNKPSQLRAIVNGEHELYIKKRNHNFDEIVWNQLGLEFPQETDQKS